MIVIFDNVIQIRLNLKRDHDQIVNDYSNTKEEINKVKEKINEYNDGVINAYGWPYRPNLKFMKK